MANIKVYHNGAWENSGGGQPFTQVEKDKLSGIGDVNFQSRNVSTSVTGADFTTVVASINLDPSATYILFCAFTFVSNYTGGFGMRVINGNGLTTPIDEKYITSGTWNLAYTTIGTGSSTYNFQVSLNNAGRTGTVNAGAAIRAIRIK